MAYRRNYIRKTTDLGGGRKLISYEPAEGFFGSILSAIFIGFPILLINLAISIIYYTIRLILWIGKTIVNIGIFTINRVAARGERHWWLGLLTLLFWLVLYAGVILLAIVGVRWYLEYAANYEG